VLIDPVSSRYPQRYPQAARQRPRHRTSLQGSRHQSPRHHKKAALPSPPPSPAKPPFLRRLDALTDLAHRCHGLLLAPDGQLTHADAAAAAHVAGLEPDPERNRGAFELLLLLAITVGILRADGLRIRAAPLHDAWRQLDDNLRAGLLYAA
jgi:hypothetical protein